MDKIMMVGVNDISKGNFSFDNFKAKDIEEDTGIFDLKFEPSSFGGKDFHNNNSTSIFDDWDS